MALGNDMSFEEELDAVVVDEPTHRPQLKNLLDPMENLNEDWKPTSIMVNEEAPVEVSSKSYELIYAL